jgi:hypothetical protein
MRFQLQILGKTVDNFLLSVSKKAYLSFVSGKSVFEYPDYAACLSKKEISKLSLEHVDAIQHAFSVCLPEDKEVKFLRVVNEQYEVITPPPKVSKKLKS